MTYQKSLLADLTEKEAELNKWKEDNASILCRYHPQAIYPHLYEEVKIKKTGLLKLKCKICINLLERRKEHRLKENKEEKEKLTNYYIIKKLRRGKNKLTIDGNLIPQPLIDATRAVIQIKNKIDALNAPLKKCAYHGHLYRDDVIKAGKHPSGNPAYKCRKCMKDLHAQNYKLHKQTILLKQAIYRKENPKRVAASKKKHRLKKIEYYRKLSRETYEKWEARNPELAREKDIRYKAKMRTDLLDGYVREVIMRNSNITREEIPESLVELKRASIMLKRVVRKQSSESKLINLEEQPNGETTEDNEY